jgi:hypothetical protein
VCKTTTTVKLIEILNNTELHQFETKRHVRKPRPTSLITAFLRVSRSGMTVIASTMIW